MRTVRLIHWNESEAQLRVCRLRNAGYAVEYDLPDPTLLKIWKQQPPAAFVIDLSRLPSHGRDIGLAFREAKGTRHVPLVFVDGQASKVERIQQLLPDATFASWRGIRGALQRALAKKADNPVVPESSMAGYSQTPLPKKLGIKADSNVVLMRAPDDFERTLGELPAGVKLRRQGRGRRDLTIWFVQSLNELEQGIDRAADQVGVGGL